MKYLPIVLVLLTAQSFAQVELEEWGFRIDPEDVGVEQKWFFPGYDGWKEIKIPSCWNVMEGLDRYEGVAWYRKNIFIPDEWRNKFILLRFLGSNYRTDVWINGEYAGYHEGGFTEFHFDVSDMLKYGEENVICIRVDNTRRSYWVPAGWYQWWNWGGICREVFLEAENNLTILGSRIIPELHLENEKSDVEVTIEIYNRVPVPKKASLQILIHEKDVALPVAEAEEDITVGPGSKFINLSFQIGEPKLWSPDNPNLYLLKAVLKDGDEKTEKNFTFGIRKVEIKDNKFLLNGRPLTIKGVSRHEEFPGVGRVVNESLLRRDFELIKSANINLVRLGHYPNHPLTLSLADEYGLMVYEEIPAWQLSPAQLSDERVLSSAERQLKEMIQRDFNHPSVVIWGIANEIASHKPEGRKFVEELYTLAKNLDPTRLVTFASFRHEDDLAFDIVDIISINEYLGWYFGKISDADDLLEGIHERYPDKPILVTEFGAGAVHGNHGKRKWTEEFQARFLAEHWKIISSKDYVIGGIVWSFADFRDPRMGLNPIPYFNLKGITSYEREPKLSYHVVSEIYAGKDVEIPVVEEKWKISPLPAALLLAFIALSFGRSRVGFAMNSSDIILHPLSFSKRFRDVKMRDSLIFLLMMVSFASCGFHSFFTLLLCEYPLQVPGNFLLTWTIRMVLKNPFCMGCAIFAGCIFYAFLHFLICRSMKLRYLTSLKIISWGSAPSVILLPLSIIGSFTLYSLLLPLWLWSFTIKAILTREVSGASRVKSAGIVLVCEILLALTLAGIVAYIAWPMLVLL